MSFSQDIIFFVIAVVVFLGGGGGGGGVWILGRPLKKVVQSK